MSQGRGSIDQALEINLNYLLEYNQERLQKISQTDFFTLLNDGTLENPHKKELFLACLNYWSTAFQKMLFARQAFCSHTELSKLFLDHLKDEFGHDELISPFRKTSAVIQDPIIEGISTWFIDSMVTASALENIIIIHFVLENAAHNFMSIAQHVFKSAEKPSGYFNIHADLDDDHARLGFEYLEDQTPATYAELHQILIKTWNMLDAVLSRMAFITKNEIYSL